MSSRDALRNKVDGISRGMRSTPLVIRGEEDYFTLGLKVGLFTVNLGEINGARLSMAGGDRSGRTN